MNELEELLIPPSSADAQASVRCEEFLREFSRERDFLASYIRSLLPNPSDAEDVLQCCSLLLWQKFEQFDRDRSFRAWACGVAFYEVRNFLRSTSRGRMKFSFELMEQIADQRLEEFHAKDVRLGHLQACVQTLKEQDQHLLNAFYSQASPLPELARDRGMTVRSLSTRLWRLRQMLVDCVNRKLALCENSRD